MQIMTYSDVYYKVKNPDYLIEKRLEMIHLAQDIGILKTSKFYKCSRNTVKRWLRRYLTLGKVGLLDMSRKPHTSPRKLSSEDINKIKEYTLKKKEGKKYINSRRIHKDLNINTSYETVNKYVNEVLGKKKNRKRIKTNGGSTDFKKDLKPFELVQVDVKYLTDIDNLRSYFKYNNLVKYELTFRDVATGFSVVAYADEKSVTNSELFLKKVIEPFLRSISGLDLKSIRFQTDNGTEFTNKKIKTYVKDYAKTSIFTDFINKHFKDHKTIIPGHCTAQSEVESFHWTIERECLAWEDITDNESLIYYVSKFMKEYNNKKRFKRDYSPVEKIESYFNCKVELPEVVIL